MNSISLSSNWLRIGMRCEFLRTKWFLLCCFAIYLRAQRRTKRKGERWHRIGKFNNSVSPSSANTFVSFGHFAFVDGAVAAEAAISCLLTDTGMQNDRFCRRSMRCFVCAARTLTHRQTDMLRTLTEFTRSQCVKRRTHEPPSATSTPLSGLVRAAHTHSMRFHTVYVCFFFVHFFLTMQWKKV